MDTKDALEEKIRSRKRELRNRIVGVGFSNCGEFLIARIDRDRFEQIERLELGIQSEETRISTLVRSKSAELEAVHEGLEKGLSLEMLEESRKEIQKELDGVKEKLAEIHVLQEQQRDHIRQRTEHQILMDKQQVESDRWARLNELIGSYDGKAFRTFAQGITFEHLIRKANRHLSALINGMSW